MDAGSDLVCQFRSDHLWWWRGINRLKLDQTKKEMTFEIKIKPIYRTNTRFVCFYWSHDTNGSVVFSHNLTQIIKPYLRTPEIFLSASIYTFSRWLIYSSKIKKNSSIIRSRPNLWPTFTISTSQIGKQSTIQLNLTWPWKTVLSILPLRNTQTSSSFLLSWHGVLVCTQIDFCLWCETKRRIGLDRLNSLLILFHKVGFEAQLRDCRGRIK